MIDLGSTFVLLLACAGVWLALLVLDKLAYRRDVQRRLFDDPQDRGI